MPHFSPNPGFRPIPHPAMECSPLAMAAAQRALGLKPREDLGKRRPNRRAAPKSPSISADPLAAAAQAGRARRGASEAAVADAAPDPAGAPAGGYSPDGGEDMGDVDFDWPADSDSLSGPSPLFDDALDLDCSDCDEPARLFSPEPDGAGACAFDIFGLCGGDDDRFGVVAPVQLRPAAEEGGGAGWNGGGGSPATSDSDIATPQSADWSAADSDSPAAHSSAGEAATPPPADAGAWSVAGSPALSAAGTLRASGAAAPCGSGGAWAELCDAAEADAALVRALTRSALEVAGPRRAA